MKANPEHLELKVLRVETLLHMRRREGKKAGKGLLSELEGMMKLKGPDVVANWEKLIDRVREALALVA